MFTITRIEGFRHPGQNAQCNDTLRSHSFHSVGKEQVNHFKFEKRNNK